MIKVIGKLIFFLIVILAIAGCVGVGEKQNQADRQKNIDDIQSKIIADLEVQYDMEFQIVEVFEGGITVGGRRVPTSYLIECLDDGTQFRYTVQDDGEIDDFFPSMKLGNDYYKEVLKEKFDSIYGKGNYVCQVLLSSPNRPTSREQLENYVPEEDLSKQITIYLAVKIEDFQLDKESEKIEGIYNGLENFNMKDLEIGFFENIPSDIEGFLAYETTGVYNTFASFYLDSLIGVFNIMSGFDGIDLSSEEIEKLYIPKEKFLED